MGCLAEDFRISAGNRNYGMQEGTLYEKANGKMIAYFTDGEDESYVIPDNITSIGDEAFFRGYDLNDLKSITIPNSVISIGDNVFIGCDLETINISDSNENYELVKGTLFEKKNKKLLVYLGKEKMIRITFRKERRRLEEKRFLHVMN